MEEYMDIELFLASSYELKLEKEWESNDEAVGRHSAPWAPSTGPRFWGQEDDVLELVTTDARSENDEKHAAMFEISDDEKLMAVATNSAVRVYDVDEKLLRAELLGHEENIRKLRFWNLDGKQGTVESNNTSNDAGDGGAKYILLSQDADVLGADGMIVAWYLDAKGRLLHHSSTDEETSIQGKFLGSSSASLSSDRKHFIHSDRSLTTQGWMRPSDWLPQLVIRSLTSPTTEVCRLRGHSDVITWASWSPTDPAIVASTSWDESFCVWNASTGERIHDFGPTGGQNWSGDFSPDGRHILFAGMRRGTGGAHVAIYDVASGEQRVKLADLDIDFPRCAWSGRGDVVAFASARSVFLWAPFDSAEPVEVLKIASDGSMRDDFCTVSIKWLDRKGDKLLARTTDDTIMIWDRAKNWKWRLQKPRNITELWTHWSQEVFVDTQSLLYCLDGDMKIRTWKL